MNRATCPDSGHWQVLLDDCASGGEPAELVEHLETCTDCQRTLEILAADRGVWESLPPGLSQTARNEPALQNIVATLKHQEHFPPEEETFPYLRPAEIPGLLGMLGPYEIHEVIGRGGMGVVFKAIDPALHRVVAIKVMTVTVAGGPGARQRFAREAKAAAAVCHEHIVTVHGVDETNGLPYLVMQYVAGESLQARLDRGGPLDVVDIVRIGSQTALGLAAAHAQGLIHRDIKPANLLMEDGLSRVRITDFGLARMADDVRLTQNGVVAGTPEYMSPEQARGEPVDHRADLFSLGCMLYAMCTGSPPFRGPTTIAVVRRVCEEPPVPVRQLNPAIPQWLEHLIELLLAKDPTQRVQTASEVAELLEAYRAHLEQPAIVSAPKLQPSPRQGKSSRGYRSLLAIAFSPRIWLPLLVLLAVLGWAERGFFLGGTGESKQTQQAAQAKPERRHVVFDLRQGLDRYPALSLDVPDAATTVSMDAQGLRITLPGGQTDRRPTRLKLTHGLRGDVDITLGYELIAVGTPLPKYGAGLNMSVAFDGPDNPSALISRFKRPQGDRFGTHKIIRKADGSKKYVENRDGLATKSKGKLRIVRTGSKVQYLAADEGLGFTTIRSTEIGTGDVQSVEIECSTMWEPIALDVRLTELAVDADQFLNEPQTPPSVASANGTPPPVVVAPRQKGLMTVVVLSVFTLLVLGLAGALLLRRRRKKAAPEATPSEPLSTEPPTLPVRFACETCGQKLKINASLAGKKVKCPQCATAVLVPEQ